MTFFFSRLNEIRETASNKQSAIVIGKRQDARSKQPHHLRTFKRIILDRTADASHGENQLADDRSSASHTHRFLYMYIYTR